MTREAKYVSGEKLEAFAGLVDALITDPRTNKAFSTSPISTLEKYGIRFADAEIAKAVEAKVFELVAAGGTGLMPGPDDPYPPFYRARTRLPMRAITGTVVTPEDVLVIDDFRVDVFIDTAALKREVVSLRTQLARLGGTVAFDPKPEPPGPEGNLAGRGF